jgi:hypothetical protein
LGPHRDPLLPIRYLEAEGRRGNVQLPSQIQAVLRVGLGYVMVMNREFFRFRGDYDHTSIARAGDLHIDLRLPSLR